MADADFGYVGSGPGKITLYKGKEVVKRNVNSEVAVEELINLIKENEAWVEAYKFISMKKQYWILLFVSFLHGDLAGSTIKESIDCKYYFKPLIIPVLIGYFISQ